jgi:hypothetical protein
MRMRKAPAMPRTGLERKWSLQKDSENFCARRKRLRTSQFAGDPRTAMATIEARMARCCLTKAAKKNQSRSAVRVRRVNDRHFAADRFRQVTAAR